MYINYGDRNFFESGRLVDSEHSDDEIRVLFCEPYADAEDLYFFADCTVDLKDNWIDWDAVCSFAGMPLQEDDDQNVWKAIMAIEYYGAENFSSPYCGYQFSKAEIMDMLKHYQIAHDNLVFE